MRAKIIALSTALLATFPVMAHAQITEAERRMLEAQQSARDAELRQRLDQTERAVGNLDLRLRTEENLQNLRNSTQTVEPRYPTPTPPLYATTPLGRVAATPAPGAATAPTRRPMTADEIQAAELAAGNARLRALSGQ